MAALQQHIDIQRVASGEMSSAEFQERNKARAAGAFAAVSLFIPGPEDVALAFAARTRLGASIAGRVGGFCRRLFSKADDVVSSARIATEGAQLTKEAQKSIRSLEKQIAKHETKLKEFKANPTIRSGMEDLPEAVIREQQARRIRHLETEIQTFKDNIGKILRGEL